MALHKPKYAKKKLSQKKIVFAWKKIEFKSQIFSVTSKKNNF
jgi:hypothetical protein